MRRSSFAAVAFRLSVVGMSLSVGCASNYQPEGQFWPVQSSGGSSGAIGTVGQSGAAVPTAGTLSDLAGSSSGGGGPAGASFGGVAQSSGGSNPSGGTFPSAGSGGNPAGGRSGMGGGGAGGRPGTGGGGSAGGSSAGGPGSGGSSGAGVSTTCSLSVAVTTTAAGGQYAPRNVGAIWVANSTGTFVKSLEVWGNQRLSHVTAWNAATKAAGVAANKVDAITSATLSAHRTHNVTWNCQNYNRQPVADGTYRVYFELTDSNQSGPNHFETFAKGAAPVTVQGSSNSFNNISLVFKP